MDAKRIAWVLLLATVSACAKPGSAARRDGLADLTVNVRVPDRAPAAGILVTLASGPGAWMTATTDEEGVSRFRNVEPGSYTVSVLTSALYDRRSSSITVLITPNQAAKVSIQLKRSLMSAPTPRR